MLRTSLIARILNSASIAIAVYVLVMLGCYGIYDGYLDHGEPIISAAAYKMLDGVEVYGALDGPNFVSNVYGPYLYLVNGLFLAVFGGSAWAGKFSGLAAAVLSVLITWRTYRTAQPALASSAVISIAAVILLFVPYSIWNRPDPLLMTLSALAVLVARSNASWPQWMSWVLLGALGGVALGLKIYGPLFFMPIGMYVALRDKSFVSLLVMSAVGFAAAFLPFALDVFPLGNLLAWFSHVAAKPTDGELVTKALRYGIFFLLPAVMLLGQRLAMLRSVAASLRDPETAYAALTLAGAGLCVLMAAKPGAGMYYLLPFAPLSIDMMIRTIANVRPDNQKRTMVFSGIMIVAMLATAVPVQKRFYRALDWTRMTGIKEDLHAIMRSNPDKSIQMAVGSTIKGYHNTLQKTELIYAGNPYTIDFGIIFETSYLGIALPQAVISQFDECQTDIWLVPKGETPLTMKSYYGIKIVDERLVNSFNQSYKQSGSSKYFDVWACKRTEK